MTMSSLNPLYPVRRTHPFQSMSLKDSLAWKMEAVYSMAMGTYTKIFLQFPQKFWFDTQVSTFISKAR